MDINTRYSIPVTYLGTNVALNQKNNVESTASTEEKKDMEHITNGNSKIWEALGKEYDIRNSSFDELCDMSKRLYEAGQISLFDHATLTFDSSKSPQPIKPNLFLTEANANGKRDWIAEYEKRAARDLNMGNMMGYRVNKNILAILNRLR